MRTFFLLWLTCIGIFFPGCSSSGDDDDPESDFVGDNPATTAVGTSDPSSGTTDSGEDDGGREVTEADIVFVEDDKLYALSAYAGLAVVDVSAPDEKLPVVGRHRVHGQPFEMYVESGQVFAMMNDYGSYAWDDAEGSYTWHSASRLIALDASTPSAIVARGEFEVPGWIQDSRRVGDILYIVTYEDGWCWGCADETPRTVVTSLDISDPAAVRIVDQLELVDQTDDEWDWSGPRSVMSTNERLYVGGIEYDGWESGHSVIDVIDIADPGGVLHRGASLRIAGSIQSRWQMDEHDGVLRVISQPWDWGLDVPPEVETFTVASANEITPLGNLSLTLPRPEVLQSVRFDGPRAYAITFEQTDPLFTIDLSDPAMPLQVGELEIPGWIHHMEPRGDRIVALGFDRNDPDGSINVSLFDVADLAAPALLSRVSFGGDWAYFGEDQNRIHKAFTILDELGLVLVPFSGWEYESEPVGEWACGDYHSGVQIVDWADDTLVQRGVAPSRGQARRALLHRDRLFALSDQSLQAFDIADRDAPTMTGRVALATNVTQVAAGGGLVVRLADDWWTDEPAIEVVSASDPEGAEPIGRVALVEVSDEFACHLSWGVDLFVHGEYAYLVRETYDRETYDARLVLDTLDLHDPASPTWLGAIDLPFSRSWGGYGVGVNTGEVASLVLGDAMVFASSHATYDGETFVGEHGTLEIVDLGAPAAPLHAASVERPFALAQGGLLVQDDTLTSWHMRAVEGDPAKVRFYFDRFDVSSPASATAATPINVPGQVVGYDASADRLVTVGFELERVAMSASDCWSATRVWSWDEGTNECLLARRPLHLLALDEDTAALLDTLDVEADDRRLGTVMGAGDLVFAELRDGSYWGGWEDDAGAEQASVVTNEIAVVTGTGDDALAEASRVVAAQGTGWVSLVGVSDDVALFVGEAGLGIVDAADPEAPQVTITPTYGWGCNQLEITEDAAYCPMGPFGLQAIALP